MSPSAADLFRMFDTCIVSDALDDHGIDGVITGIGPAAVTHTTVGRAHTIQFGEPTVRESETNFPFAMLNELVADRVLVIAGGDPEISYWGGNASRLAENASVNGVVVDGGFRDVPENHAGSFPLFGRGATPKTGQRRVSIEDVGTQVEVDGVTISPEDLVVADATGVVVVPADAIADIAETAEEILAEELILEEKIANGATVSDLQQDEHVF